MKLPNNDQFFWFSSSNVIKEKFIAMNLKITGDGSFIEKL